MCVVVGFACFLPFFLFLVVFSMGTRKTVLRADGKIQLPVFVFVTKVCVSIALFFFSVVFGVPRVRVTEVDSVGRLFCKYCCLPE